MRKTKTSAKHQGAVNLFNLCKKELKNREDLRIEKYKKSRNKKIRDTEVYNLVGLSSIAGHQWKIGKISMQSVKYLYQISTKLNIDMNTLTKVVLNKGSITNEVLRDTTLLQLGGKY